VSSVIQFPRPKRTNEHLVFVSEMGEVADVGSEGQWIIREEYEGKVLKFYCHVSGTTFIPNGVTGILCNE